MKQLNNRPLISVIMPVRNGILYVVEAIESIRNQTYTNWELLCVDDASTDGTSIILESYAERDKRIKIYRNKTKKGISYSLNKALRLAQGEFIARMDADDVSLPHRFGTQLHLLLSNPQLVACGGQAAMTDFKGNVFAYKRFPTDSPTLYKMIMKMVPLQHPILMSRASVFKQYRYDETVTTAEDVDMLFYLLSKGPISNVDSVIYKYRKSALSNGYHNVKKTFSVTVKTRLKALIKYGYKPTVSGVLTTLLQYGVVSLLPSKAVVMLFEAVRFDPPLWKRPVMLFTASGRSQFLQPVLTPAV